MTTDAERLDANRRNWDERVPIHLASPYYDLAAFRAGRNTLHPFELEELTDVAGKALVHLQCHFGMDTLSWARLGARVTGLDFSNAAIEQARALAHELNIEADFVTSNVYDAVAALQQRQFDIVYVNMGSLVWLPDVHVWADIVAQLLRPGGRLYLLDGHPYSHVFGEEQLTVEVDYFSAEPMRWDEPGSYADANASTAHNTTFEWTHTIGSIITSLATAGLHIEFLHERAEAYYQRWPFLEHGAENTYRMPADMPTIPLTYSLMATKPHA
ncbi:MAG: methyltransferase domain-containing protein [Chloroflexi bacterium]|nr:MAG: methyltransferase domain-containing protein [Chloroflexota bacterium]